MVGCKPLHRSGLMPCGRAWASHDGPAQNQGPLPDFTSVSEGIPASVSSQFLSRAQLSEEELRQGNSARSTIAALCLAICICLE